MCVCVMSLETVRLKQVNETSKRLGCKNILRRRAFRVLKTPLEVSTLFHGDQRVITTKYVTLELCINGQIVKWDVTETDFNSLKETNLLCFKTEAEPLTGV